jgi:tetratricopeptide (TPR) repeat protein
MTFQIATLLLLSLSVGSFPELSDEEIAACYTASYNYEKMESYGDAVKALLPVYENYKTAYTVNLRLGWLYYLKGNFANSLSHYAVAQTAVPGSIEPMLGKSLPLMAQLKWEEVEALMLGILAIDAYNYYGSLRLSLALRMQAKAETAKKVAARMLGLYPSDVSFLVEIALCEEALGNGKTALRIFRNVLILDPQNVEARNRVKAAETAGDRSS